MEYIIGMLLICLLLFLLGMEWTHILILVLLVVGIGFAFLFFFFAFCLVLVVNSTRVEAVFTEIKLNSRGFISAHYLTEGKEYPNLFPCEVVMRSRLYVKDKPVRIRLNRKMGVVLDKNAVSSIYFGLAASLLTAIMIIGLAVTGGAFFA